MASASYSDGVTGQDQDALERPTPTVLLLWTGAWDSTFRLLTLISETDCIVQPYYVIDRSRPSWSIELDTIEKIMQVCRVPGRFPGTVLQPIIANKDDISPHSEIEERYKSLFSKKVSLADQYEWLSRYATRARGLLLHATQLIWVEKAIGKTPEWLRAELRKFGVGTIVLNLRQRCRLWLYRQILRSE